MELSFQSVCFEYGSKLAATFRLQAFNLLDVNKTELRCSISSLIKLVADMKNACSLMLEA